MKQKLATQQGEIAALKATLAAGNQQANSLAQQLSSPSSSRKRARGDSLAGEAAAAVQQQAQELDQLRLSTRWESQLAEMQAALARSEARANAAQEQHQSAMRHAQELKGELAQKQQQLQQLQAAHMQSCETSVTVPAVTSTDGGDAGALGILEARLEEQATRHGNILQDMQGQLQQCREALAAAKASSCTAPPTGTPTVQGSDGMGERCAVAEREAAALRKQLAAAERRQRRLQSSMEERSEQSESILALRDERNALQEQVSRLQSSVQAEARCTAALHRGVRAAQDAAKRLADMHTEGRQDEHAAVPEESAADAALDSAVAWSRLATAVDAAVQGWTVASTAAHENAQLLGTVRAKLVRAERQATEHAARASALEGELASSDALRIQAITAAASAERRVASLTREVEAMEAVLTASTSSPARRGAAAPATGMVTPGKASLDTATSDASGNHLAQALKDARAEIAQLRAQSQSDMTPNAAVGKIREQLQSAQEQLAGTQKQLQGALAAQEKLMAENAGLQHQVGRGDFNTGTTKVLHLRQNPLKDATAAVEDRREAQVADMQAEMTRLRVALLAMQSSQATTTALVSSGVEHSSAASVLNESAAFVPALELENAKKKTERLMSVFKDRMKTVKDGLYEITGWKVNVDQRPGESSAVFRLSSQFAERESDEVKFHFTPGGEVSMLETEYCPSRVDPKLLMLLQIGSSGRLPAFLASLTLDLHSKQTLA